MESYRPNLHKDAIKYARWCDVCQRIGHPTHSDEMPLQPQLVFSSFDEWGLGFIGPMDTPSNNKVYILVFTDYLTKWLEFCSMKQVRDNKVVEFN